MRFAAAFLLALGLITGCSPAKSGEALAAPLFELKDLSGKTVALDSFKGHPVMLDFWATWCGPCRISIPHVQEFYMRHKAGGLVVLGVNMDEDTSEVSDFVKRFKMTYPVLYGGGMPVSSDYQVEGIPHFVFIDLKGNVVQRFEGFSLQMPDAWEETFQQVMAKPS
jgi:cytochrome c biogenesis protein CcmG/thiol:disulfide interchange protein DsbE